MDLVGIIALLLCLNFAHVYGLVENRLFKEAGEYFPGQHFRFYHAWLGLLDVSNAVVVYALSGSIFLGAFVAVYFPFGLDWMWWVKRWLDFKFQVSLDGIAVFLGAAEAEKYYNEPNAWHLRTDWDNYLGLPLVGGCYWWWWIFGGLSVLLAVLAFIL
jgi:hypothetical protein